MNSKRFIFNFINDASFLKLKNFASLRHIHTISNNRAVFEYPVEKKQELLQYISNNKIKQEFTTMTEISEFIIRSDIVLE